MYTISCKVVLLFQFVRYFNQALQDRKWEEKVLPPAVSGAQVGTDGFFKHKRNLLHVPVKKNIIRIVLHVLNCVILPVVVLS